MSERVTVWKLTMNNEGNPLIMHANALDMIQYEVAEADPGDVFTVEVAEMDKAELDALPEWDGW